jgi:hypothetical protein
MGRPAIDSPSIRNSSKSPTNTFATMKKIALVFASLLLTASCWAGPYSDELKKCLVEATSKRDTIVLVRWLSKALLAHPEVKDLAAIPHTKALQIDKDFARYVERLLGENCSTPFANVVRYEDPDAIRQSFEFLGQVAMKELMDNAQVQEAVKGVLKQLDMEKIGRAILLNF